MVPMLRSLLPARMERYVEPCVGGGALLFTIDPSLERTLSDANEYLINAYRMVQSDVAGVIEYLEQLQAPTSAAAYRALARRAVASSVGVEQAALCIATVKTTFGAKWEVDAAGRHRGTWSHREVALCDAATLRRAATQLRGVRIECGDVVAVLDRFETRPGDVVYVDPPYLPDPAGTFTSYTEAGFTVADHCRLAEMLERVIATGAYVMLSINDTPLARELYAFLDMRTATVQRRLRTTNRADIDMVGISYAMPG